MLDGNKIVKVGVAAAAATLAAGVCGAFVASGPPATMTGAAGRLRRLGRLVERAGQRRGTGGSGKAK
jgi:hypothetical protein